VAAALGVPVVLWIARYAGRSADLGPLLTGVIAAAAVFAVIYVGEFAWRFARARIEQDREELGRLREWKAGIARRNIEIRIYDVAPATAGPEIGALWPRLIVPVTIMVAQVSIRNSDSPTTLKDWWFVVQLNDGRHVQGWFPPDPFVSEILTRLAREKLVPAGRDIRQLTATKAFGGGDQCTGWLVGVFAGMTPGDLPLAGQKFYVWFRDADDKVHGHEWNAEYTKPRPTVQPGLAAPDADL
jgi:hypothetical protein